jgi:hypothetical protein
MFPLQGCMAGFSPANRTRPQASSRFWDNPILRRMSVTVCIYLDMNGSSLGPTLNLGRTAEISVRTAPATLDILYYQHFRVNHRSPV